MGDKGSKQVCALLPAAKVAVFVSDEKTLKAAEKLGEDWRFARVEIVVENGDVETAIEKYSGGEKSPDLIIIETKTTDESFTERLDVLSSHCEETTSAVVLGPVNDVNLYRALTSLGVSDYLVIPVDEKTLGDVIAKVITEQLGTGDSQLIAVIGAKGGVGTSAISQALAWGMSEKLGQKTLLMDAANGKSTLGVGMGFEAQAVMKEAVTAAQKKDRDGIKRMQFNANNRLDVLAFGSGDVMRDSISGEEYETLLDSVMEEYPYVVADLSGSSARVAKAVTGRANGIVIVSTPVLSSLRSARIVINEIKSRRGGSEENIDLVINMVGISPSGEVSTGDIEKSLGKKPSLNVPFLPKVFIDGESRAEKITQGKEGTKIVCMLLSTVLKTIDPGSAGNECLIRGKGANPLKKLLAKIKRR